MKPDNDFTSFVLLTQYYKIIILIFLTYFVFKFKDWVLGAIIVFGTLTIYFQQTGHETLAVLMGNPTATLLAYKLVQGAKHRLEVKNPTENPPSILPDALHSDYNKDESKRERREDIS